MSPSRPPDTSAQSIALVNARVWTGDARRPWADAVLTIGDRIELVGSSAEVKKRASASTTVLDAKRMLAARTPDAGASEPLRRGEPANVVVVRENLLRVTAEALRDAEVVLEIAGGVVVVDRDGLAG